jgi:drug/metabolite transporter (DMT)-like permease
VSPVLVVVFGLSIAGANFMYYASLSKLSVAVAITVQYTAPALVVAWTILVEGVRPSRRVLGALAAAVAGVALLAELPVVLRGRHLRLSPAGFGFSAAAAVAFSVYMITGERLGRRIGARRAVTRGFVVASVLWLVVQMARGRPHTLLDARFVPGVLFLAVVTTVAPFWLFVWGMERVRAWKAGIVSTLEPLTAAMIAYVWLGQTLSVWQVAGALMVLCGVAIVQMERPSSDDVIVNALHSASDVT